MQWQWARAGWLALSLLSIHPSKPFSSGNGARCHRHLDMYTVDMSPVYRISNTETIYNTPFTLIFTPMANLELPFNLKKDIERHMNMQISPTKVPASCGDSANHSTVPLVTLLKEENKNIIY